jgi:hypothetical protein
MHASACGFCELARFGSSRRPTAGTAIVGPLEFLATGARPAPLRSSVAHLTVGARWKPRPAEEQRKEGSSVGVKTHTRLVLELPRRFTPLHDAGSLNPTVYGFLEARVDFDRSRSTS